MIVTSLPGHSQILPRSRGEKSGSGRKSGTITICHRVEKVQGGCSCT